MTLRGHIQNGTVVLEQPTDLPDGTLVNIEPAPVTDREAKLRELADRVAVGYDFDALDRLREASKL